jgi:predicted Zn-dependent peptidase
MESDRMGHLLGVIDQKVLDEQRSVVKNEKREGQNKPYGQAWEFLSRETYPSGHPYRHTTIGSMNDLDAASLDDVKGWFRTWYGPNNAVLVLAGDIDLAAAKKGPALQRSIASDRPYCICSIRCDGASRSRQSHCWLGRESRPAS